MKSSLKLFCIVLMSAGLMLPACKKQEEAPADEAAATEEVAEEEGAVEEAAADTGAEAATEADAAAAPEGDAAAEAEGDAAAAEEGEEQQEEAAKPAPKPDQPVLVGTLTGDVGGGGVTQGELRLSIDDDYSVTGYFQGKREDQAFRVPLTGKVAKAASQLTATGESGASKLRVTGKVNEKSVSGQINGVIFGKDFETNYTLVD
jgi:hypothetical protein